MNPEPDFTPQISSAKRRAAERRAAEEELAARQRAERQRALAIAEELLSGLVRPVLEKAAADLRHAELVAELGNGRDRFGALRLSLRIAGSPDALVFTACDGMAPYLGWHAEPATMRTEKLPSSIPQPTREEITRIIGEFIRHAIT